MCLAVVNKLIARMGAESNFSPVETIRFSELSLQCSAQVIKTN